MLQVLKPGIKRTECYSLNESQYRYVELNKEQCTNESYLLTGLSVGAYFRHCHVY